MALSAKNPMPESDRLELLVEDAFRLWKDIPTAAIPTAVDAAIIQAGGFEATAGLVAKCWKEKTDKPLELMLHRPGFQEQGDCDTIFKERYWAETMQGRWIDGDGKMHDFRKRQKTTQLRSEK